MTNEILPTTPTSERRPKETDIDNYTISIALIRAQEALPILVTLFCLYGTYNTGRPTEALATALAATASMVLFVMGERTATSLRGQREQLVRQSTQPAVLGAGVSRPTSVKTSLRAPQALLDAHRRRLP